MSGAGWGGPAAHINVQGASSVAAFEGHPKRVWRAQRGSAEASPNGEAVQGVSMLVGGRDASRLSGKVTKLSMSIHILLVSTHMRYHYHRDTCGFLLA